MDEQLLVHAKHIPYDYQEEKQELTEVLKQARVLNEIQTELASFIDIQENDIQHIEDTVEETAQLSANATVQLELASGKKFRFTPILIGSAIGGILTLPLTIGLTAPGVIIGYAAGGGALLGGVIGKKLA
jgi:hypothetical protein